MDSIQNPQPSPSLKTAKVTAVRTLEAVIAAIVSKFRRFLKLHRKTLLFARGKLLTTLDLLAESCLKRIISLRRWFSWKQWVCTAFLSLGSFCCLLTIGFPNPTFDVQTFTGQCPLEWAFLAIYATIIITSFFIGVNVISRWTRNPFTNWVDVLFASSAFSLAALFFLSTDQLRSPHLLGHYLPICLSGSCIVALTIKFFNQQTGEVPRRDTVDDATLTDFDDEDEFNRVAFKNFLTDVIKNSNCVKGSYVIAITGPWGSGKSTLLEAIRKKLDKNFIPISIESWKFRNTGRLLETIVEAIARETRKHVLFFNMQRFVKQYSGLVGHGVPPAKPWLDEIIKIFPEEDKTDQLQQELSKLTSATGKRFVVFLDDVERLTKREIHDVLRAIRLAVSIPNITYVLAYDRKQLLKAADIEGTPEFLDKIIDEEFEIPQPAKEELVMYLNKYIRLQVMFFDHNPRLALDFESRLQNLEPTLSTILDTPRKVKQVARKLRNLGPYLRSSINPMDLFLLEILRQRFNSVYLLVKSEPELFWVEEWSDNALMSRIPNTGSHSAREKERLLRRQSEYERYPTQGQEVSVIIDDLFPSNPNQHDSRLLRRVCHPSFFTHYFLLSFLREQPNDQKFEEKIHILNKSKHKQKSLRKLLSESRFDVSLEKLELLLLSYESLDEPRRIATLLPGLLPTFQLDGQKKSRVQGLLASLIAALISTLDDDQTATDTIVEILQKHTNIAIASYLIKKIKSENYGIRHPDLATCQEKLDNLFNLKVLSKKCFFDQSEENKSLILENHSQTQTVLESILNEMLNNPIKAIDWLKFLNIIQAQSNGSMAFTPPSGTRAQKLPLLKEAINILDQNRSTLHLDSAQEYIVKKAVEWYESNPKSSDGIN